MYHNHTEPVEGGGLYPFQGFTPLVHRFDAQLPPILLMEYDPLSTRDPRLIAGQSCCAQM